MTSSMLSGERRWASSRRGSMTVLGKVAVPKPINLPSQRLENHGEDPNVEIVPKGTLSWGNKSSSSASNAWGSSMSPNANRGTSSPSHLSARPSSGGSGTRPSSSGSDRALEHTTNAWGSNSRPSSASGALTSSQTLQTSLRPRSAETRPGSSKLSQFADHMTENSVAWNAARTTERLGITQHKNDGFSLSSGDFPTLGSEKDKSEHSIELQDHDSHIRPASCSGLGNNKHETSAGDGVPVYANLKGETENSWRREYQAFNEDRMRPGIEKWQGNHPPYPNAGIPPQHFDPWRGAPVNSHHGDVWFRGPPNGPPFANPVAPGGFPIEPFPFYRPNIPPTGLANPPQVPPPGTGPRGQHKNGEAYRPHIPDAYIPPGMPLRPGFYPGPMAYEGYYGPPLAYHNSNEQDVPFMGMAVRPTVYNRYPNHNPPEPSTQGRASVCGPAGKPLASELAEPSHAPDTAGKYRVLLKQHNEWGGKNEPTNWEDSLTTNASYANVRDQPRVSVQESDHIRNAEIDLRTSGQCKASQTSGKQGSSSVNNAKPLESIESLNKFDNISERKVDGVSSNTVQIPSRPSAPKDSILIQKIEGLNAKARDNPSTKSKEEQRNKFHSGNRVENEVSADVVFPKTTPATEVKNPKPHGIGSFGGENNFESPSFSGTATSRQISHGMQDRSNHRKGGLNTQDTDGWRKKSGVIDSSSAKLEVSNIIVGEHKISVDAYERSGLYSQVRRDGESIQTVSNLADSHAQRAKTSKVKESAKQRIKPLQEDEEGEQAKMQKVKTPQKLDESNRRSLAMEGSMQRKYAGTSSIQTKQEEFQSSESKRVLGKSGAGNSSVMPTGNGVCQNSDTNINRVGKPPILSSETPLETLKYAGKGPVLNLNPSETLYQDVNCADAANALHHSNVASKNKRMSYKQKQNISSAKTSYVSTTSAAPEVEDDTMASVNVSSGIATNEVNSTNGSGLPMNSTSMAESSVNQKKKNNRNSKSKQKTEETSPLAALPSAIPREANLSTSSVVNKPQEDIEFDQGLLQSRSLSKDSNQYSGQKYLENEESYGRTNSQLKSQHSWRMPRNMQATNRQAEKSRGSDVLMWAPVKSQDKTEIPDELSERTKTEVVIPAKCDQQQVHNLKNKRAEMERYIPKPVAKEMAQQGSLQQMVSSISQAPTDNSVERFDSGPQITRHTNLPVERAGSGMESKNRDSRQTRSRQGKAHESGSWRQRNPTESSGVHDMEDGGKPGSNSSENVPLSSQQVQMSETSFLKRQTKHANDTSKPDGSNNPDNHDSAVQVSVSAIKDHKAINTERQVPFRRQKGTTANHDVDQKKNAGDTRKTGTPLSSTEHSESDADAVFKENLCIGERLSSHWQPKFQASNNHRGSKPNTKDSTRHDGASFPEGYNKESNALMAQPSEKSRGGDTPNIGNPEDKRERRNAPSKDHPHFPSQVAVGSNEEAPTGMDPKHQQRPSSGVRKNGNQNRFGKGHESPGDWIMPAQDDGRHHNRPTNQDRRDPDRRYHHGDSTSDNFERTREGNYIAGEKFRERGQTHPRRGGGNFSGH